MQLPDSHLPDFRFPRSARLLNRHDFRQVFDHPLKSSDRYFTVLARQHQQPFARLGLAISKKNLSHAVDRNRIKRITRESFRHHQQSLSGLDVVVMARNGLAGIEHRLLEQSLEKHWNRLLQQCEKS